MESPVPFGDLPPEIFLEKVTDLTDSTLADTIYETTFGREDNDAYTPEYLNIAGDIFWKRYEAGYRAIDLERAISSYDRSVHLTPEFDPEQGIRLSNLGLALYHRFRTNGDVFDMDMACFCFEKSLLVEPLGARTSTLMANFGAALQARAERTGNDAELSQAVTILQQADCLTPDDHPEKPLRLTNLGNAFERRFERFGDVSDIEKAISVKQKAVDLIPNGHPDKHNCLNKLGNSFDTRFDRLGVLSDLEMAVSLKHQAVDLIPDGHPDKPAYLTDLGNAFDRRFNHLGDVLDLEMAISIKQKTIGLIEEGHPNKLNCLNNLGVALKRRFIRLEEVSDLEMAVAVEQKAVDLTPDDHPNKPGYLTNLGNTLEIRFDHLGKLPDLELAITAKRQAVELTPDNHPEKPSYLNNLGTALETRFRHLGDVSDLESTIAAMERSVELTPDGHLDKPSGLLNLTRALMLRYERHKNASDLEAAINRISTAAQSIAGVPRVQLQAAQEWSRLSEMINDEQQTLRAYDRALNLIPRVAWMGLAIEGRHRELEQIGELVRNAAAAAVRSGDPERALQWLEQGRSIVWGQTLQQRSPLDLLHDHDPVRAVRLTEISRNLESNAKDEQSSMEARGTQLRALVLEWDALVLEVRRLEGFDDFLGPKKVAQLLKAASSCPVIVLNAHETGCDALILMPKADIVIHVPLTFNSRRARELVDDLEMIKSGHSRGRSVEPVDRGFRIVGKESYDPEAMIKSLLAELWTSVVKPVLDGLSFSLPDNDGDDLPRICWCPTGPVAFLPIHAAGLYDTDERGTKVFDLIVSSYTPTVSALLQAPSPNPTLTKLFAVSQAQQTNRGFSALPSTSKEIRLIGKRAAAQSIYFVVAEDGEGTVKHVLTEMMKCNWVHLACHGTQDLDDPTKSAFILANGDLELSEIIKHPLPHAEFAFLSACQTATGDAKLADEAVHLAAGMMLAGYRSVIATMWSILDKDGPTVADDVYAEMLKDGKADYTRAAYALYRAIRKLRLAGAPFMAWMPFIHMGR